MKKRLPAILLILAMTLTLVACGGGGGDTTSSGTPSIGTSPPPGTSSSGSSSPGLSAVPPATPVGDDIDYLDTIIILTEQPLNILDTLHPAGTGSSNRTIYSMLYDKLFDIVEGEYIPQLATSWEISDDLLTYTFNLRDDVTFSNGDQFTAQSVIDTFELSRAAVGTEAFDVWRTVDTLTASDAHTLVLRQSVVDVDIMFRLSLPWASIINKRAIEADNLEGRWVGTGPFTITGFVAGDYTTLTRRDDYWRGQPPTREVTFRWVPETTARTVMMVNGEAHLNRNTAPEDMDLFLNSPDFDVYTILANVANTIMFNMNHPICSDRNFRLAVAHALDLPAIAMTAGGIWEVPVENATVWGIGTEFRNNDLPLYGYDLDLARQYLADSVYNGEELELVASSVSMIRAIDMIQENLGRIGINIRLYPTDTPTLSSYAVYENNQAELIHFLNTFDMNASSARNVFYPGRTTNRASYNNPEVTDLLDRAPMIADASEREAMYRRVQEIVYEDMPYISLFVSTRIIVAKAGISGIILNRDMNHDFKFIAIPA